MAASVLLVVGGVTPQLLGPQLARHLRDADRNGFVAIPQSLGDQFGLTGMGVAPAGVERPNTGHHHLLIDTTLSPDELKQPIVMDAKHMHFGGGQTETMLTLLPGQHSLQLQFADWLHVPFNPPVMSPAITLMVK
jgi:hypothetical protein